MAVSVAIEAPYPAGGLVAADRLSEHLGCTECGAVLDYPVSGYFRFLEKKLSA